VTQTSLSFPVTDAERLADLEEKQKIALKWLFDTQSVKQKRDREKDGDSETTNKE